MILIIGGAFQGKLRWAASKYTLYKEDLCDLKDGYVPGKRCYFHLEALSRAGEALPAFADDAIVIAREIGSGVVPMDAGDRAWRERHGAYLQQLAKNATHVYRIFCGLSEELK